MANITGASGIAVCADCNQPADNHVCPLRVGTVAAVTMVNSSGRTVLVKQASTNPPCALCGLVHHNERSVAVICVWGQAARLGNFNAKDVADVANWETLLDLIHSGQIVPGTSGKRSVGTVTPTIVAPPTPAPAAAPKAPKVQPTAATPQAPQAAPVATPPEEPKETPSQRAKRIKAALRQAGKESVK